MCGWWGSERITPSMDVAALVPRAADSSSRSTGCRPLALWLIASFPPIGWPFYSRERQDGERLAPDERGISRSFHNNIPLDSRRQRLQANAETRASIRTVIKNPLPHVKQMRKLSNSLKRDWRISKNKIWSSLHKHIFDLSALHTHPFVADTVTHVTAQIANRAWSFPPAETPACLAEMRSKTCSTQLSEFSFHLCGKSFLFFWAWAWFSTTESAPFQQRAGFQHPSLSGQLHMQLLYKSSGAEDSKIQI